MIGSKWRLVLIGILVVIAFVALPFYVKMTGNVHLLNIATKIAIFSIAAVGLNLILGFGGMVSLGHAAYLGIGGYAVGILASHGITSAWIQWPLGLAVSALAAFVIGSLSLRTKGVFFIMVTLAFAQMIYFIGVGLQPYGGDDGLTIYSRSEFGSFLPLGNRMVFYFVVLALLALVVFIVARIVNSPFGLVLKAAAINERRVRAVGYPAYWYQLAAFVISGTICGLAGILFANHNDFISPAVMHWTRSGDLVLMLVLGGMSTVLGPVFGVIVFMVLEEVLVAYVHYWQFFVGIVLFLVIRYAQGGIEGFLARRAKNG